MLCNKVSVNLRAFCIEHPRQVLAFASDLEGLIRKRHRQPSECGQRSVQLVSSRGLAESGPHGVEMQPDLRLIWFIHLRFHLARDPNQFMFTAFSQEHQDVVTQTL
jgi:hypothetical protein